MDREEHSHNIQRFKGISVGKCHVQTATDRFGPGAKAAILDRELHSAGLPTHGLEIPQHWPTLKPDSENDVKVSIYQRIPSMQRLCNNLTALSQVHNLYFVAYQCRIFVYRPRSVPAQTIPSKPDVSLTPEPTEAALFSWQSDSQRYPHTINHLIAGLLGNDEIVVACYDDGDVVAYYVKNIEARVLAPNVDADKPLDPFLHTNVGKSAWGLAIHQKSRLLAVSSNRHEITVFAFALTTKKHFLRGSPSKIMRLHPERIVQRRVRNWRICCQLAPNCDNIPNLSFVDDEKGNAEKVCGIDINGLVWIVNIWKPFQPPICILPLPRNCILSEDFPFSKSRGWGVFVLPESAFLKVKHISELFGVPLAESSCVNPADDSVRFMASIRPGAGDIPGNPCPPPNVGHPLSRDREALELFLTGGGDTGIDMFIDQFHIPEVPPPSEPPIPPVTDLTGEYEEETDSTSGSVVDSMDDSWDEYMDEENDELDPFLFDEGPPTSNGFGDFSHKSVGLSTGPSTGRSTGPFEEGEDGTLKASTSDFGAEFGRSALPPTPLQAPAESMVYYPHSGEMAMMPWSKGGMEKFVNREVVYNTIAQREEDVYQFGQRYHILRAYEKDLELKGFRSPEEPGPGEVDVLFPNITRFGGAARGDRDHFYATGRLSMMAHMPELSALAIGSPTGRVVILTLTRKTVPAEHMGHLFGHGFRVERILPLQEDEKKYRRSFRPLYGMAVAPVQQSQVGGSLKGRPDLPQRYRIMLHYRNHDILTYEITREGEKEKLCIF